MREKKFSKYWTASSCKTEKKSYDQSLNSLHELWSVRKSDSKACFQTWNAVALRCKLLCEGTYFGSNKITAHEIIHAVNLLSSKHQPRGEHLIPSSAHLISDMSSSYRHVFGHTQCAQPPFSFHFSISYRELFPFHFKLFQYAERSNAFATWCSSWFELKATANRYYLASRWRREAENIWLDIEREIWMHNCRKA